VEKSLVVLLIGDTHGRPVDLYQQLQEQDAAREARAAGYTLEVSWATSFEQYGVLRKRLGANRADAVIVEPASVATASLILNHLRGRTGLVLLNVWDACFSEPLAGWGTGLPVATISQPQELIGRIQGRQILAAVPRGGHVLVVTGPTRSSAARERLEGLRSEVRDAVTLHTAEAGQWTEADGILAFESWYGVFRSRKEPIHAIAGQSDDLAVGAHKGSSAVQNAEHAAMFHAARLFGVGAVPGYGRERVADGTLSASVAVSPNAGLAVSLLRRFWADGRPLPLRTASEAEPYPPASAERLAG
jgi:ABC-type sugar transport system substrate-binding protein